MVSHPGIVGFAIHPATPWLTALTHAHTAVPAAALPVAQYDEIIASAIDTSPGDVLIIALFTAFTHDVSLPQSGTIVVAMQTAIFAAL